MTMLKDSADLARSGERALSEVFARKILVAVDGSEVSFKALGHALRIAKSEQSEVIAIHVIPKPPYSLSSQISDEDRLVANYYESARKQSQRWLGEVEYLARKAGVKAKVEVLVDATSIVESITTFAEMNNVDLIVTGTKGRSNSKKILMGSVATGVVTHAHCAVLVVR
ncbi:MAG: universal stress protein [Thaumarchaeota archaeon]|nr:universal stress protein [Nitrososphaerota archaeon]